MMASKPRQNQCNGWLIIDKPLQMTSADVVWRVKKALKLTKCDKIGHAGTLDPLASGVLPIALGHATKCISFMMDAKKRYRFRIKFGESRTTDDAEGEVVNTSDVRPQVADIQAILPNFIGSISQMPPVYSALKVGGRRAYELARKGEEVTLAPRDVVIDELILESMVSPDEAEFSALVGKGTYIRSLARDIAAKLGSCGYVSLLIREQVGNFHLSDAILLDFLDQNVHNADSLKIEGNMQPMMAGLGGIPAHDLSACEWDEIRHGRMIEIVHENAVFAQGPLALTMDGELVALAQIDGTQIKPKRVFIDE